MAYEELDLVALNTDIPAHGLKRGAVGTVVFVYGERSVEVEFLRPDGGTQAVLTLSTDDLHPVDDHKARRAGAV